ncbi:MAG TPA: biosynthetic-type acetolactate synthase large subunit [Armatimonadota bacterium]|jgi:acetolactate synthase-1/2/3 large subunit
MATRRKTTGKSTKMTGSEIICRVLEEEGVDILFGIPGGQVIPLYDEFYRAVEAGKLRNILTRHEQGAAHMADGYARATGKVGVCVATSGPGALNLVTGLATANLDSVPMVAITGQVKTEVIGKDAFQEADIRGVTTPVTKHNYLVKNVDDLGDVLREAFHLARSGRPGAVLVDVPSDLQLQPGRLSERHETVLRGYSPPSVGDPALLRQAAELIKSAQRPVLYVGGGIIGSGASEALRKLADKTGIPVTHTLMGKGAYPETHHLSLGMPGMHGTAYASRALHYADLVLAVGVRFDDRVTGDVNKFAQQAAIVHIDVDPAELNKIVRPHVAIAADARLALEALLPLVRKLDLHVWMMEIDKWRKQAPMRYPTPKDQIAPQFVIEELWRVTSGDALVTTEVGQNQMWAAQYYPVDRPRQFLTSGGMGTMGWGFPAAIGAQFGCPDQVVWDIAGDGSIQMNIQELATATQHKLPVKVAILNNGVLGMVRQWQTLFYGNRLSGTILRDGNPDFAAVARAYGAEGITVRDLDQLRPALERAMEINDRPVFVDIAVWPDANVMPMIPGGKSVEDLIMEA